MPDTDTDTNTDIVPGDSGQDAFGRVAAHLRRPGGHRRLGHHLGQQAERGLRRRLRHRGQGKEWSHLSLARLLLVMHGLEGGDQVLDSLSNQAETRARASGTATSSSSSMGDIVAEHPDIVDTDYSTTVAAATCRAVISDTGTISASQRMGRCASIQM